MFRLIKMNFAQSPGISKQFIRSFDVDAKQSRLGHLATVTDSGMDILPEKLAKISSSILSPSTTRQNKLEAQIENGWEAPRIMFSMVVQTSSRPNNEQYEYIVGHTDEDSVQLIGGKEAKFSKRMKLYFDSITHINLAGGQRRSESIWVPSIKSHDLVLNRDTLRGFGTNDLSSVGSNRALSKRPEDIFRRRGSELAHGDGDTFISGNNRSQPRETSTTNTVGTFTTQLKLSDRDNNSPTEFLQKSIGHYVNAATRTNQDGRGAHYGLRDDASDMVGNLKTTYGRVGENDPSADPYIEELKATTRILNSGFITYGELLEMNPEFVERDQSEYAPYDKRKTYRMSDSSAWRGDDNETIAAYTIASSLPALMIKSMYSKVDGLVINSYGRSAAQRVFPPKISPYVPGLDTKATWPNFEHMVSSVLIEEVSRQAFEFEAKIDANVDGWIDIWIRVDNGPEAFLSYPAWGANMLTPILDNNTKSLVTMSTMITDAANDLSNNRLSKSRLELSNHDQGVGRGITVGGLGRSSRSPESSLGSLGGLKRPEDKDW